MIEKLLVAVDDSAASRRAVEYVGRVFGHHPKANLEITLFQVIERMPAYALPKQGDRATEQILEQALHDWSAEAVQRTRQQLERYRELLLAAGIADTAVRLKHRLDEARPEAKRVAAALAILDEVKEGGYTTVVVGRRGASNIPELFVGGVAEKVSRHVAGATVWIVD